jgi:hypothetical protein
VAVALGRYSSLTDSGHFFLLTENLTGGLDTIGTKVAFCEQGSEVRDPYSKELSDINIYYNFKVYLTLSGDS